MTTTDLMSELAHPATPSTRSRATELRRAAFSDIGAVSSGVVPFGLMLGITAATTGAGTLSTMLGAALVFGGSAQLTTMTLLHLGTGLVAALLSGVVVNARVMLYGAALEPRFRGQPLWFRLIAPAFIQDQTFLSTTAREPHTPADFRRYWTWLGLALLAVWTGSVGAGILLAPVLPPLPHLALVGTALFVSMLVPKLADRASVTAAVAGAATALVVSHLAPTLAILAGTAAGLTAAMAADRSTHDDQEVRS